MWLFGATSQIDSKRTARVLLQYAVKQIWHMQELPEIEVSKKGKPWFPDYPECYFNLSHSGSYALCGLSDFPIGIDIEETSNSKVGLAYYIMNLIELARFCEVSDKIGYVCSLWTLKESYVKCTGEGIAYPPQEYMKDSEFDVPPGQSVRSNREGFIFRSYSGDRWRAAVCVKGVKKIPAINWVLSDQLPTAI